MGLDIRVPLGLIFLLIGGILVVFGVWTQGSTLYAKSLGTNLNLLWGAVMAAFGGVMFLVGRRQRWQNNPGTPRPWEKPRGR